MTIYRTSRATVRIRWIAWLPFPWRTVTLVTELYGTEGDYLAQTVLLTRNQPPWHQHAYSGQRGRAHG